jgi:hypothetical protein
MVNLNFFAFRTMSVGPRIVFDEEEESDIAPILLRFRQPSFTKLDGIPIPKGFDSLSDFRQNKVLTPFLPHLEPSLRSSPSAQELLIHRNAKRWEELGYSPQTLKGKTRRETMPDIFAPYPRPGSASDIGAALDRTSDP